MDKFFDRIIVKTLDFLRVLCYNTIQKVYFFAASWTYFDL